MNKTVYLTIKVRVNVKNDVEDVADMVSSHCDYDVTLDDEDVEIIDTEMIAASEECPI